MYKFYIRCASVSRRIIKFLAPPLVITGLKQQSGAQFPIFKSSLLLAVLIIHMHNVSANVSSQGITMDKKNVSIEEIFRSLKQQTDYDFVYSKKQLEDVRKVSITVSNASLKEILDQCFKDQPITYVIEDKTIIIKNMFKKAAGPGASKKIQNKLEGKVIDMFGRGIAGVTIRIPAEHIVTRSNDQGEFLIKTALDSGTIIFSHIGYAPKTAFFNTRHLNRLIVSLRTEQKTLTEVAIISTGYQDIERGKTTGSYVQVDNKLINRSVSTSVIDRIKDLVPGIFFQERDPQSLTSPRRPSDKNSGIVIRGESTLSASKEPLIILDNFPYEGDLRNINPNDVEHITVLKDAAAASIWGTRSGNGVIVITTKKGKYNQKLSIDFNSSVNIIGTPNVKYSNSFLTSTGYLEVEQLLFDRGYFDAQLNDKISFPVVSPAVEIYSKIKNTAPGSAERTLLQSQIDKLRGVDVRDNYKELIYRTAINQQYSLGLRGGSEKMNYTISLGRDINANSLKANGFSRTTINSLNTFKPSDHFELIAGLNYSNSIGDQNNQFAFGTYSSVGGPYGNIFPYANLVNELGDPEAVLQGLRKIYLDNSISRGSVDWNYRPLDEIKLNKLHTLADDLLLRLQAKYITNVGLSVQVNYQKERQRILRENERQQDSYYVRNLINRYAMYDPVTNNVSFVFPKGGILEQQHTLLNQENYRFQLNYERRSGKHFISNLLGAEMKQLNTEGNNSVLYGYNNEFGTAANNLNYGLSYPTNPSGNALLPGDSGDSFGILNRNISYFSLFTYSYDSRYLINLSARRDGANLFGARTNDRITPLWSAGIGWNIDQEDFYHVDFLPKLGLRTSLGYQGNTYDSGSAFLTGSYSVDNVTGAPVIFMETAPNPRLRWEKIRNFNIGIDFGFTNNVVSGTIEIYKKDGRDLIQPNALPAQTGFTTFQANSAKTRTHGVEMSLSSENLKGALSWRTSLIASQIRDKILRYDVPRSAASVPLQSIAIGSPLNALYSYKWAGLNPLNGNPRGMLNGVESDNYNGIINNYSLDSLAIIRNSRPALFGSLRNDFSYRQFSLSVNITYRFLYHFRRPSVSTNYTEILQRGQHSDYYRRWQQPGDEAHTAIPSIVYPALAERDAFYRMSEALIEPGDHIRLQDIRLAYALSAPMMRKMKVNTLTFFSYINNVGLIWKKSKADLDPAFIGDASVYPNPRSISFGVNANF